MSTTPLVAGTAIDAQNPWPGLSSFDEAAQRFFSGRDAESAELVRLAGQAPLTVLFGKSGLGKTSLLQAGLFPRLRQQNVLPVYVRLDVRDRSAPLIQQAAAALGAEVARHGVDAAAPDPGESLWEHLHRPDVRWWSPRNEPLTPMFVFDQFEEAFTLGAENADAVERLRLDLADLVENRISTDLARRIEAGVSAENLDLRGQRYKVLLSFREDFLPEVEGWKQDLPSVMRNRLRLLPMSAERAWQVVTGQTPAGRTHTLVNDETARDIVRFVAAVQIGDDKTARSRKAADPTWDKLEIEPALLSLVCAGLNERRKARGQAEIDAALLRETGESIIGDFYQRCVADVPDKTRRFIEDALITEGGFRNSYPLQDALDQGLLTLPLLRQLVDRRLLRVDHQLGADRVELIHDRLTEVVREYRDRERERIRARRQRRNRWATIAGAVALFVVCSLFFSLWRNAEVAKKKAQFEKARADEQAGMARADKMLAEAATERANASLKETTLARENEAKAAAKAQRAAEATAAALRDTVAGKLALESRAVLDGKRVATPDVGLLLAATGFRARPSNEAYGGLQYALGAASAIVKVVGVSDPVLAVSPDAATAVTLARDGTLRLWDLRIGQPRGASMLHPRGSESGGPRVAFSPDGRILASGWGDQTLRLWDTVTGKPRAAFVQEGARWAGHPMFSPDGKTLLFGLFDSKGETWRFIDIASGGRLSGASINRATLSAVAFSPDGRTLVSSSDGKTLRLWDAATGESRGVALEGEPGGVASLAFSRDGKTIVSAGLDGTVRLWDAATGRNRRTLDADKHGVLAVAISADGETVASSGLDRTVRVWNALTGQLRAAPLEGHTDVVRVVAFSRDGKTVISAGDDKTVRWWDRAPGQQRGEPLAGHDAGVLHVAFSPDSRTIVSGGYDRTLRLWDVATGRSLGVLVDSIPDWVTGVAFSRDGKTIVSADGQTLRRWDAATGATRGVFPAGHTGRIIDIAFSPDGKTLASASQDATVRLWDAVTGEPRGVLADRSSNWLTSLAISPDGKSIVSGDAEGRLHRWNVATRRPLSPRPAEHERGIEGIAFSPDGKILASAGQDQRLRLWNAATGQPAGTLGEDHPDWVMSVAFSPDGQTLVSVDVDGQLRLWDAATGQLRGGPVQAHTGGSDVVAYSPDGKTIATGGRDKMLRLWDAPALWIDRVCAKLVRNLSHTEWTRYVGEITYQASCPGLPVPRD
jgi:WD40 repeat protein